MQSFFKKCGLVVTLTLSLSAFAGPVVFLNAPMPAAEKASVLKFLNQQFDVKPYREVRVQTFKNPDYYLLYLFSETHHAVELAKLTLNRSGLGELETNYQFTTHELESLSRSKTRSLYACPDTQTEFVVFAPNESAIEQNAATEVANAAKASGLKTAVLLKSAATHNQFLNYLKCPKLRGSFYDGDANKQIITTVDGAISYVEIQKELPNQFQYQSSHIWVACEAFLDPFKSTLIVDAAAKKYAAGINKLLVGPSDKAAACAMSAAFTGQQMAVAFKECYDRLDDKRDKWGLEGAGSDYF